MGTEVSGFARLLLYTFGVILRFSSANRLLTEYNLGGVWYSVQAHCEANERTGVAKQN